MALLITKADGTREAFDNHKLMASLARAGADRTAAHEIAELIGEELFDGITTQEIYRRAFAHLRNQRKGAAARYSLKRAVWDFGPSGFPFETYVAALLRAEGWEASTDRIIQGACVEHEVDVVAKKGGETLYVEAKFHNSPGFKTDLKTALYVKARMDDIRAAGKAKGDPGRVLGLLVTNTKFTTHASRYAACAGLELLSWEEPNGKTLHDRIDAAGLYPVTALTSLSRREKTMLLEKRIVLCSDLSENTRALAEAGVVGNKATAVLEEVGSLCNPKS
ncbi:MAG: ATP-cone domain protein [Candidatus Adlerbacteria bacterium]|nr:ATP-cone domain protein [Candidatus Adlerbacteria bacterium]